MWTKFKPSKKNNNYLAVSEADAGFPWTTCETKIFSEATTWDFGGQ